MYTHSYTEWMCVFMCAQCIHTSIHPYIHTYVQIACSRTSIYAVWFFFGRCFVCTLNEFTEWKKGSNKMSFRFSLLLHTILSFSCSFLLFASILFIIAYCYFILSLFRSMFIVRYACECWLLSECVRATIADNVWLSSNYQMIMAFYHFHLVIIIRKIRCF